MVSSYQLASHLKQDNRFAEIDVKLSEAPTSSSNQDSEPSEPGRSASTPEDRLRSLFQKLGMQDDIGNVGACSQHKNNNE